MFSLMNSCFHCFERIFFIDRDDFCCQYGTVVNAFIGDEVHHDACMIDLATLIGFESTFDGVCAREGVGQGGVEIDDFVRERRKKGRRENPHPASKDTKNNWLMYKAAAWNYSANLRRFLSGNSRVNNSWIIKPS